jgi:hypothetical protein
MDPEFNEEKLTQEIDRYFKSVRKKMRLNETQTDFICESEEGPSLDTKRLLEYEKMILQTLIAGFSSGYDGRLPEKMKHVMDLIAQGVRIVDGKQILNIGSWKNLQLPEFLLLDHNLLKDVQRAKELLQSGQPIEAETLFASRESQEKALQINENILRGTNVLQSAVGVCRKKGIGVTLDASQTRTSLSNIGNQAVYQSYAGIILRNSTLSGKRGLIENRYFVGGMIRDINASAKK